MRSIIPAPLLSLYHFLLAQLGAFLCGFPSQKLLVIAVTGTKGKSSTTEFINAILEEAGYTTALLNSIRIKTADASKPNTMRMSMPGRFFIQRFLSRAVDKNCTAAILEMTSEGARQHRHRAIELDALIFTNLAPEHIESHGSYEKYADAKFEIGKQLARSKKRPRIMIANAEDAQSARYVALPVEKTIAFSLQNAAPNAAAERGGYFTYHDTRMTTQLPGEFSLRNALAAAEVAYALEIPVATIAAGIAKVAVIPGRAERIDAGQKFDVIVDYAHTPDSLEALYAAYASKRKICVMGATGGGRDTWKRPVMGKIAAQQCDVVILTNEDPYDENPHAIIDALASDMHKKHEIIIDRREAIRHAISIAKPGDAILITGKGTDPTIQGPHETSVPWSDADVAREELTRFLSL